MRHWIEEYNQLGSNATGGSNATRDQLTESGSQGVQVRGVFTVTTQLMKGAYFLKRNKTEGFSIGCFVITSRIQRQFFLILYDGTFWRKLWHFWRKGVYYTG